MLTVLTRHTVILWGFLYSYFWMQNNLMKALDMFRLEILIHPISSLPDKGTWPQRSTCQAQSASLRTLMGDCWLIRKPWGSCLPWGSLLWWWLLWALPHGQVLPDEQAGREEKGWVTPAEPSQVPLSIHTLSIQHSDVRRGSERPGRNIES